MYDGVQLVQNSAALNGTQRVLLDRVISEEECSDLRHLAHVRTKQHLKKGFQISGTISSKINLHVNLLSVLKITLDR